MTAILFQTLLDSLNGYQRAADNAHAKDDDHGQHPKVQMQQLFDPTDHRQIHAEDQQYSGAGNAGQEHGGNGNRTGQEQIQRRGYGEVRQIHIHHLNFGIHISQRRHNGNAKDNKGRVLPLLLDTGVLFLCNDKDRGENEAQEQGRHGINIGLKEFGENQYCQNHTHSPAQQQFNEVDQAFFFLFLLAIEYLVNRADELVIKSQNQRNGATGHAGHTIRQRHTKAVDHCSDHKLSS